MTPNCPLSHIISFFIATSLSCRYKALSHAVAQVFRPFAWILGHLYFDNCPHSHHSRRREKWRDDAGNYKLQPGKRLMSRLFALHKPEIPTCRGSLWEWELLLSEPGSRTEGSVSQVRNLSRSEKQNSSLQDVLP